MRFTLIELMIGVVILGLVLIAVIAIFVTPPQHTPREEACTRFCQSVSLPRRGIDSLRDGRRIVCTCGEDLE